LKKSEDEKNGEWQKGEWPFCQNPESHKKASQKVVFPPALFFLDTQVKIIKGQEKKEGHQRI